MAETAVVGHVHGTALKREGTLPQRLMRTRISPTLFRHARDGSLMDCRHFRKHHLAYLDDTLSGDQTVAAQCHVLVCDACAAHDTLVRRSLMMARSLPAIEPSAEFQRRLRARLVACRSEPIPTPAGFTFRSPRMFAAVTVGAVLGTLAWRGMSVGAPPVIAMQPVVATQPALPNSYITPALMQAMSTGNPVWPVAMLIEDAPTRFVTADLRWVDELR